MKKHVSCPGRERSIDNLDMSDVEDEGVSTISLKVKTTTTAYDVQVKANATISDVKDVLVTKLNNVEKSLLCLIFSGKILKDHEKLETHNIGDGMALHLVVRQGQNRAGQASTINQAATNPSSNPTQTSGGSVHGSLLGEDMAAGGPQAMAQQMMNNPEMMRQMMDNPIMQNIMGNPEIFRSLLANNPQIQQLIERNPELGHVLNDPDMMRQTMEMIRNPNMFQEMMRNHDLAIRNLQGIPGGEAALQRLYQDVQEPLLNSATSSLAGNPFASLRRGEDTTASRSQRAGQENSEALPNPWGGNGSTNSQQNSQGNATGAAGPEGGLASLLGSSGMNSLMEQMMSDPALMQSLMRPEMMDLFRQSISQNPQVVQQIMEQNPLVANNPQLAEQLRAQLPNMMNMMSNPDVLSAMSNPRVLEGLRMVQQGMDILRREAPALAGMFGSGFTNVPGGNNQRSTPSTNSEDPVNSLNAMFAGMNTQTDPEVLYASQLEQLAGMGFSNRAQNIAALRASFGDLNAAVERLLNSP
ncbi:Ubiquitin domain-containing protein DSK2a [Trichostrongylus colubriformis]|uniref:Ubiquitin domain-containing protein DSK2a n=1 Tax=Trichostrongylus colubriformis TaxID=6319 RepID=A0AAN8IB72_TRICO